MSTPSSAVGKARVRANWIWLAVYVVAIGAVIFSMISVRRIVLREMSTPEAIAQWQTWRDAEPNQTDTGPVKRRPPSSAEPPVLVLLRDYFGVMLAAAVFFSSLLFGAIMVAARGVFSTSRQPSDSRSSGGKGPG